MRFTEIDGKRYEIKECGECPFRDMGDGGWGAHCTYPGVSQGRDHVEIDYDGIAEGCPLREAEEHKPCPFCGSTRIRERYLDDACEEIDEQMVEKVNSYAIKEGFEPYRSVGEYREENAHYWQIYCPRCDVHITSDKSIEDAWAKWNRRAGE